MPELIKAVDMVRSIRDAHYARIKDLSTKEKIAFFREKAHAFHAELGRPEEFTHVPPRHRTRCPQKVSEQVKRVGA
jgi:hypothetical protein